MKLSFSTYGRPDMSWRELCEIAQEMRFQGVELYDIARLNKTDMEKASSTARSLRDAGIAVVCLDTVCDLGDTEKTDENCKEIEAHIRSAQQLNAPYVRVRALENGTEDAVRACLDRLLPTAEGAGVAILMETLGLYADTKRLASLLDAYACDMLGALWDVHHPCRHAGETPDETIKHLGAYVRHVHFKDSAVENGVTKYRLVGEGTLPLIEAIDALHSIDYDGYCSLELNPEQLGALGDPSVACPHFISFMSRFESQPAWQMRLYPNKAGTGQYVWKKDILIDCTFPQVLDRMVREFPDQYAFKYTTLDYTRTYGEFSDDVDTFARALISLGVKRGTKVAVWATNIPQWFISFWAAVKIGAVLVTVNTAYKITEAEYLFRQSDTHTLIMIDGYRDSSYSSVIQRLCPEMESVRPGRPLRCKKLPFLRNVITVGFEMRGALTWNQALEKSSQTPVEEVRRRAAAIRIDDVCNMQYTSGTTGFPKGVMLTHRNVVNNGKCIGDRMDLSTADRMMIQVPMFHCFGMVLSMTASMTHGTTMLPLPYFSPKQALNCISQEHITCFNGVPTMFIAMLSHEDFSKTDFSHIRTGIMAGSNCPESVMREAAKKMGMTGIVSVYGQTEASPGCTMSRCYEDSLDVRVTTVGGAFPEVSCRVVDPATGADLENGATGEFVVRGYNVMKGYYKMPCATQSAINKDGWLHTGDLCTRDDAGNYRITGRLKDMIIRGGENIYPKEIEEFLYTHPKISDVQVIGVPDPTMGEEIMAFVILKEGETVTEAEIKEYVRINMARHKVPRYVAFTDSFPMNAAGKIQKYKMREAAIAALHLN